jgi:hypothetical protein
MDCEAFHRSVNNGYNQAMAPRGMKPKPQGESRFRGLRMHDWVEVDGTAFDGGPDLPARRRTGEPWPDSIREKWAVWRSMPHASLWREPDWEYALDTIELAATAFQMDAKVGLLAELRFREKQMGTTWSARQDMHIRYVEAADVPAQPATVTTLEEYRDL